MRIIRNPVQNTRASVADVVSTKLNRISDDFSLTPKFVSDKSLVDQLINDQYVACCSTVKEWIRTDQEKAIENPQIDHNEEIDVKLLQLLDMNICYEIIEFIPTFSKYKSIRKDEDRLASIKFPHPIERTNSFRIDSSFVTFHKMRIISKHFNGRMMKKLLTIESLLIADTTDLKYIYTLLREQTKYSLSGKSSDSLYLYQDVKYVASESSNTDEFTFENNFSKIDTSNVKPSLNETSGATSPQARPVRVRRSSIGRDDTPSGGFSFGGSSITSSGGFSFGTSSGSGAQTSTEQDFSIENATFSGSNSSTSYSTNNIWLTACKSKTTRRFSMERTTFSNEFLSAFVGENSTIKKIVFCPEIIYQIVKVCKQLKTVILCHGEQQNIYPSSTNAKNRAKLSIEHLIVFGDSSINRILESFSVNKFDIYNARNRKRIIGSSYELNIYTDFSQARKMIDEHLTCFGMLLWETANVASLPNFEPSWRKDFFDYLFVKCNFPIEILEYPNFGSTSFQYLVYLSNKYQKGRLFRISGPCKFLVDDAISYGWDFTNQLKEIPFFSNVSVEVFTRISHSLSNDDFYSFLLNESLNNTSHELMTSKVIEMLVENPKQLYQILSQQYPFTIQRSNSTFETSLPLFIQVLKVVPSLLNVFLLQMEMEDYSLFETQHFEGNTIFHIIAMFCSNSESVPLFLSVLSRIPEVINKKNDNGDSPFEILLSVLQSINIPTILLFIKKFKLTVREELTSKKPVPESRWKRK